jgi:hypothetical protein
MPRKSFDPTTEDRRLVKHLAAVGISQEDIGLKVGIKSPKTLRKHFSNELALGSIEAEASVRGQIFKDAMAGNTRAQQIWMNCISRNRGDFQPRALQAAPSFNVILQESASSNQRNVPLKDPTREGQNNSEAEKHEQQ